MANVNEAMNYHFRPESDTMPTAFQVDDYVVKAGGDYYFKGRIVAIFQKLSSTAIRYVVEDEAGILMIMNPKQIEHKVIDHG